MQAILERVFPRNEHLIDRALRIALGLALLSLVFFGPNSYWGLLGLLPLFTGLVGSCPIYTLLGVDTCSVPTDKKERVIT